MSRTHCQDLYVRHVPIQDMHMVEPKARPSSLYLIHEISSEKEISLSLGESKVTHITENVCSDSHESEESKGQLRTEPQSPKKRLQIRRYPAQSEENIIARRKSPVGPT